MPSHALLGFLVIAVPTAALLFALFALGVITFGKPSGDDASGKPEKPAPQPPFRARPKSPELSEREKRRAERRARRRNL